MLSQDMSDEEIVPRGLEIYDNTLKPLLEPGQNGRFVAVAIEDGDYGPAQSVEIR